MLAEIDACAPANPGAHIKLVGYDAVRQGQVVSFVVRRPGRGGLDAAADHARRRRRLRLSGKTTITRGLVRVLGEEQVTHFCADDYHRYDRAQRAGRGITPLDPECNYMDVMAAASGTCAQNEPILKPVYRHADGTFGPPVYLTPARFVIAEGLLGVPHQPSCATCSTSASSSTRRRTCAAAGRCQRDCSRRGYTTDQVLDELDRREPRLGGVHPAPASPRGHRRLVPPPDGHAEGPGRTSTRTCSCATRCRIPT